MPPVLVNLDEWPVQLQHLVKTYGAGRVWECGLSALRFPPTWISTTREAEAVLVRLEKTINA